MVENARTRIWICEIIDGCFGIFLLYLLVVLEIDVLQSIRFKYQT